MLSSEAVARIKAYLEQGQRIGEIASAYDVSRQSVAKIASGRTHAGVHPARSVPLLSKEAERVGGEKRLAQRAARRMQEVTERQQADEELRKETERAVWDAQEATRKAERKADEMESQVRQLRRLLAEEKAAKRKPEPVAMATPEPKPEPEPAAAKWWGAIEPDKPWTPDNHPNHAEIKAWLDEARRVQYAPAINYLVQAERAVRVGPPHSFPDGKSGVLPEPV